MGKKNNKAGKGKQQNKNSSSVTFTSETADDTVTATAGTPNEDATETEVIAAAAMIEDSTADTTSNDDDNNDDDKVDNDDSDNNSSSNSDSNADNNTDNNLDKITATNTTTNAAESATASDSTTNGADDNFEDLNLEPPGAAVDANDNSNTIEEFVPDTENSVQQLNSTSSLTSNTNSKRHNDGDDKKTCCSNVTTKSNNNDIKQGKQNKSNQPVLANTLEQGQNTRNNSFTTSHLLLENIIANTDTSTDEACSFCKCTNCVCGDDCACTDSLCRCTAASILNSLPSARKNKSKTTKRLKRLSMVQTTLTQKSPLFNDSSSSDLLLLSSNNNNNNNLQMTESLSTTINNYKLTVVDFVVQGMTCTMCAQSIETEINTTLLTNAKSGATVITDLTSNTVTVTWDSSDDHITSNAIKECIQNVGYEVVQVIKYDDGNNNNNNSDNSNNLMSPSRFQSLCLN